MYFSYVFVLMTSSWWLSVFAKAQTDISGLVGSTVHLPCTIDTKTCGPLHSVKWYRGSSRIFVFSDLNKFSKSEGEYLRRADLKYEKNDTISYLEVKNITPADESIYKCELTYLEVVESCLLVQFINLTTLIAPNYIHVYDHNDSEIPNNSAIGPYNEGAQLTLRCEVGEGKPVPAVQWFKNGHLYSDNYVVKQGTNVIGSAENKISLTLSREDLGAVYECQASSQALREPLKVVVAVKVHVKPSRMELKGLDNDVKQNTTVVLECIAYRALPAATITWYNESRILEAKQQIAIERRTIPEADSTITSVSRLKFTATRFENARTFRCAAFNEVMKDEDRLKNEKKVNIRVLYPPIINTIPDRITVNESRDVLLRCNYTANPIFITSTSWYFNGSRIPDKSAEHVFRDTTLLLKKANRNSLGKYFCSMSNSVGTTNSSEIEVNVLYPPTVEVHSDRPTTVNESEKANITLFCVVKYGNPSNLITVTWYVNNVEMYSYPNVSNLFLENVQQGHHGNYSCRGQTEAGIGFASSPVEVYVQYRPGPANITYWVLDAEDRRSQKEVVIKGSTVILQCNVENLGRPRADRYNWFEGNRRRENENNATLRLDRVGVKEATNLYSCNAENSAGAGPNGTKSITIYAPPSFLNTLKYANASIRDESVNLTCVIECYPLCDVKWMRNNESLNEGGYEYKVINQKNNASLDKNDFDSITSTLVLNLTRFPDGHARPYLDDAYYTCYSTKNEVGDGVTNDKIDFRVHFPPQEVIVSMQTVDVIEGYLPGKVNCRADARPEATIRWYGDNPNVTYSTDATLSFDKPLSRTTNTNFTCEASNKYGSNTTWVYINIKFKPICQTSMAKEGSKKILTCNAEGNPSKIVYRWTVDESEQNNVKVTNDGSVLEIEGNSETKIYNCTAENEVGISEPCMVRVPASDDWIVFLLLKGQNWSLSYIIIALVILAVLAVLICILVVILCRKRRAKEKYNNRIDLPSRQNFDGHNLDGSIPTTVLPKWPLKPGVLVHVNNNHSLNVARLQNASNHINYNNADGNQMQNHQFYMATEKRSKRGEIPSPASATVIKSVGNESQRSRAQRIKQIFFSEQLKYKTDTLPGVFHGKSGVVSFKKIDNTIVAVGTNPRKRKRPLTSGAANLSDKSKDDYHSPSDALLQQHNDKGFYENLPFHGLQNPPNKQRCDITEIRPSSAQSQFDGSSGYGSTRSQVETAAKASTACNGGAQKPSKSNCSNTMKGKFNSFRSKHAKRQWPQFRSLRTARKNKIPMLPIKESSPDSKSSAPNGTTTANAHEEGPKIMPKPVPAPRKVIGFSFNKPSAKHTYQNVPIPITPNKISMPMPQSTSTPVDDVAMKQASSHLTNSSPMEYFRLTSTNTRPPSKSNVSSNVGSLNKTKYKISLSNTLSPPSLSSRGGAPPPTIPRQHNSSAYPSAPHHLNNGLVYADLTVSRHKKKHHRPAVPVPAPLNVPNYPYHTEYAVIKFHDVGREIDV